MRYRHTVLSTACSTAIGLVGWLSGLAGPTLAAPTLAATDVRVAPAAPVSPAAPIAVADRLPDNTPVALMLETEQATWDQLLQYELFQRIADFTGQPLTPGALPFLPYGVDYSRDIAPWLGDGIAIALLPISNAANITPAERGYLVASVADPVHLPALIEVIATARQADPEESAYKGVPIYTWPTEVISFEEDEQWFDEGFNGGDAIEESAIEPAVPQPWISRFLPQPAPDIILEPDANADYTIQGLAIAILDDHLVATLEPDTLKYWIEYHQRRGPVLTQNDQFLALQAEADDKGALGLVYGNAGELAKFTVDSPFDPVLPLPEPTLREQAQVATLLRNITFEALAYPQSAGLQLEARLNDGNFLVPLPRGTVDPDTESILSLLPASTYLLGSGYDLAGLWNTIAEALSLSEISQSLLDTARTFLLFTTGLDLDDKVFGWMDSEYSVFLFPSRSGLLNSFIPNLGMEAGVLLQTRDRTTADTALNALDQLMGPEIVRSRQISDTSVRSWELDLSGRGTVDSVLSHTWLTDDTLAITTGTGAMDRLVNPFAFEALTDHSTFRNATDSFPQPNYGYVYVNAAPTLAMLYNALELDPTDPFIQEIKSGLGTLRSLSITTSSTADAIQLDALLGLAPRE
ncbi:MAG: DUF3352 domain-containing protein [Cyanobacteria bacterium P01_A01_bin.105]